MESTYGCYCYRYLKNHDECQLYRDLYWHLLCLCCVPFLCYSPNEEAKQARRNLGPDSGFNHLSYIMAGFCTYPTRRSNNLLDKPVLASFDWKGGFCALRHHFLCRNYLCFRYGQFDLTLLQTGIHTSNDVDVQGITACQVEEQALAETLSPEMDALLKRGTRKTILATIIFFVSMMVLWPLPMFGTSYIFSKGFF